ncbi:MAG TPA: right-handed parallel beta-helix repeat-containing protein [Pyrinomonadaceae bacterium]|nr:right-handed parallel beta-helix repeat-containing protein [Pyrinomonadaceae bacterium]
MKTLSTSLKVLTCAIFIIGLSSLAQAQATRTWVSGVGDDVNPCSRTAPCKTFAGAISKTAAGGEIDALDPGGFGTVTITKSISIDGTTGAGFGSILASGTQGVIVNDSLSGSPNSVVVHLRNLSINGAGTTLGTNAIAVVSGNTVHVENVRIQRFSGDGIRVTTPQPIRLIVRGTHISECGGDGIEIAGTAPSANAVSVDNSSITRCGNGVQVSNRAVVAISNSVLSLNNASGTSSAVDTNTAVVGGAIINLESCQVNNNSIAINARTNQAVRLSNVFMTGNANALNFAGGTIASWTNNKIIGNTAGENFAALTDVLPQ